MKKQKKSQTKKLLIIGLILVLVAGGSALYLKRRSDNQKRAAAAASEKEESIVYAPATDAEKQESEDNKKNLPDNTNTNQTPPSSGLKQVAVTVTSADQSITRAQVSGVTEDDGACTANFTNGSTSFSSSSPGVYAGQYTACAIRPSQTLTPGAWNVTVSYKSNTAEGSSAAQAFTVN